MHRAKGDFWRLGGGHGPLGPPPKSAHVRCTEYVTHRHERILIDLNDCTRKIVLDLLKAIYLRV